MADIKQFKAARALLEWTQDDLAKASGISLPAIANLERGSSKPRKDTLDILRKTFEENGIEFLEPAGVQIVAEKFGLKVWSGRDSQKRLWNDIYREFSDGQGGELLLSGVDDKPLVERYPQEALEYVRRLDSLKISRRILLCEGDNDIIGTNPGWYRQVPKVLFAQTAHYIYKDKVALLIWSIPRVLLIENKNVAETFRTQFEQNWALSQKLTTFNQIL